MNLLDKMKQLAEAFSTYDHQLDSAKKDYAQQTKDEDGQYESRKQQIAQNRNTGVKDTEARKAEWDANLNKAEQGFKNAHSHLEGRAYIAATGVSLVKQYSNTMGDSIDYLTNDPKRSSRFTKVSDNNALVNLLNKSEEINVLFSKHMNAARAAVRAQYNEEMSYVQAVFADDSSKEENRHSQRNRQLQDTFNQATDALARKLINDFMTQIDPNEIHDLYEAQIDAIPTPANYAPPKDFPKEICFGYAGFEVTSSMNNSIQKRLLSENCSYMSAVDGHKAYLQFPIGYGFDSAHFSTLFEFDANTREQMMQHMRSMVLRIMMATPLNKAWFTMIDPIELGKTFSVFAPWGEEREEVIDTRIWSDEVRIEERLNNIIDHTSDVNFRCLQGKYKDILEYNAAAGKNAEPLRFLMIMDFPRHFSPSALEKLESIVTNGPSSGVYALIAGDLDEILNSVDPTVQRIMNRVNVFPITQSIYYTSEKIGNQTLRFAPMIGSESEDAIGVIEKIAGLLGGEGPADAVLWSDIYPSDYRMMSQSALNGLSIPLGMEGANRLITMGLGGISEGSRTKNYHAMVGGTIGSGKSTMLHSIITGALVAYKPNELQMYLVDMKGGVEFRRYAQHLDLGNIRVLGIDAEKEFGLSVLQEVAQEQKLRSGRFKECGVSRIEAYNSKMMQQGRTNDIMPRLLVVMDEVQYLFDNEEDPNAKACARLLEDLVLMGGSAYGIQIILSTQDWENVQGIKAGIYNNIGVRIALRNTPLSAKIILADDNEIANRMAVYAPGRAVFNEYTGHKDYNREFRGILLREDEAHKLLNELAIHQKNDPNSYRPARQRLLSADVQDNHENPLNIFCKTGETVPSNNFGYRLWLGESMGMVNTYRPTLRAHRGGNMLLLGGKEDEASTVMGMILLSLIAETIRVEGTLSVPVITLFDFSSPELAMYDTDRMLLTQIQNMLPFALRVFDANNMLDGLSILEHEQQEIRNGADVPQQFVLFFGINRAKRLTVGTTYEGKPRDRLAQLIIDGPESGMNFIIWANDPEAQQQFYGDLLEEFDQRVMLTTDNEEMYRVFVQDKKPASADVGTGVSYNMAGDNVLVKLYSIPTKDWLAGFVNQVNNKNA